MMGATGATGAIDDARRTCVLHGRFRGPPLVTNVDPNAMPVAGKGTLRCHSQGLTIEVRHASQAGPVVIYAALLAMIGAGLWWLYADRGPAVLDADALGAMVVSFTLLVGGLLRQWPSGRPLRLEIPWYAVASFRVQGRKVRITVRDVEPSGELCFVTTGDAEAFLESWRLAAS